MKTVVFINILLCALALTDAQSWKGKPSKTKTTTSATPKTTTTSTSQTSSAKVTASTASTSSAKATTKSTASSSTIPTATSASASKLFYQKGTCPMKLCSGTTISSSQLANFQGSFKALSAIDVAVSHPQWSITEIKALQGFLTMILTPLSSNT